MRCGEKTTRIHFKQRLLKDNPDNVCLAFGLNNQECVEELKMIDSLDYNMFRIRDLSGGNELVLSTMSILLREKLFSSLGINQQVFVQFMKRIQGNYYDVTFHNKTHAADLC